MGHPGGEAARSMTDRRFLVSPEDLPGEPGGLIKLSGAEHHHLSRVLRLQAADVVSVFDGKGRGFRGEVEKIGSGETLVRLTAPDDRAVEPRLEVTLAQGIPQPDKMDLVVQRTTELGVSVIGPVLAERSVARFRGGGGWNRLRRWRRLACEAAKQSGRLRVPEIVDPMAWETFLAAQETAAAPLRFLFSTAAQGWAPPSELRLEAAAGKCAAAVGPEGGWTPTEVAKGIEGGFRPIGLGPRILRAETAGIVAVALVLFLAGEMHGGPQPHEGT